MNMAAGGQRFGQYVNLRETINALNLKKRVMDGVIKCRDHIYGTFCHSNQGGSFTKIIHVVKIFS